MFVALLLRSVDHSQEYILRFLRLDANGTSAIDWLITDRSQATNTKPIRFSISSHFFDLKTNDIVISDIRDKSRTIVVVHNTAEVQLAEFQPLSGSISLDLSSMQVSKLNSFYSVGTSGQHEISVAGIYAEILKRFDAKSSGCSGLVGTTISQNLYISVVLQDKITKAQGVLYR